MNNDAFKDLVRTKIKAGSSSSTSKEIARKAVEEEFRKKKKRKRGGDYASSSDEEDNDGRKQQSSSKWKDDDYDCEKKEDEVKAVWRDRAKERREGTASSLLIIPHNKKGLDIALVRKERQSFKGFDEKSITTATATATIRTCNIKDRNGVDEVHCNIKKKKPTSSEEAKSILQNFVSSKNSINNNRTHNNLGDNNNNSIILESGMIEYINEILPFDTTSSSSWDKSAIASSETDQSSTASTAGKTLQRTIYSLAIDGHPSDLKRAWEVPRQYALSSRGEGSSGKSSALLGSDVMDKIDLVFTSRNIIRSEMIKEQIGSQVVTGRIDDDNDDDDDMFGGLDD